MALRYSYLIATFSLVMFSAGCTVGPEYRSPPVVPLVQAFDLSSTGAASQVSSDEVPVDWWRTFNDPLLLSLEERAASQNLDLQAAVIRIGQSRAQVRIAGAVALPRVGVGASGLRERASPNGILQLLGAGAQASGEGAGGQDPFGVASTAQGSKSPPYSLWQVGTEASWEIDLWGRARRMREAAVATLEASTYDALAIRIALAAEVANSYVQLRGLQTDLGIVEQNRMVAEHSVLLASRREANGVATRFDAAIASAELASIKSAIPRLRSQIRARMNALALLLGEPPDTLSHELESAVTIPVVPALVPVGLPSELARRRPDIREAEARLHAATAEIGIARADFYPSVSLTGSFGLQALKYSSAGSWASRQFAIGPVLNLPIFQGGRLSGTLALTTARQQETAIRFQQVVLKAWHEVDDALTEYGMAQAEVEELEIAVMQSQIAFKTAQRRYEQGAADYLSVLIAQRDLLRTQREVSGGRVKISVAMISLYRALGGGWSADKVPVRAGT